MQKPGGAQGQYNPSQLMPCTIRQLDLGDRSRNRHRTHLMVVCKLLGGCMDRLAKQQTTIL